MINIHLTPDDLADMRFAYSPLVELATSYRILHVPKMQSHYLRWVDEAQRALFDTDLPYMRALLGYPGYIPDFLTPTPMTTNQSVEDEITGMLNTPPEVVRGNIQTLMAHADCVDQQFVDVWQNFLNYPHESLLCLVDELRLYWLRVLAHHWPRMKTVLDGDILYKARQLAVGGPSGLFADLHPDVTYEPGQLQVNKGHSRAGATFEMDLTLNGQGIQLVPAIFSASKIHWQIVPEWHPMLIYSPRGAGLWRQEVPGVDQSLELLLGAGKARVLQELETPANTGEIARKLSITAGAVSQHLSRLNQAGLVEPHRSGKVVFYHLTPRGQQLLVLFDATP
mgnify:CR=1 FL=1